MLAFLLLSATATPPATSTSLLFVRATVVQTCTLSARSARCGGASDRPPTVFRTQGQSPRVEYSF